MQSLSFPPNAPAEILRLSSSLSVCREHLLQFSCFSQFFATRNSNRSSGLFPFFLSSLSLWETDVHQDFSLLVALCPLGIGLFVIKREYFSNVISAYMKRIENPAGMYWTPFIRGIDWNESLFSFRSSCTSNARISKTETITITVCSTLSDRWWL